MGSTGVTLEVRPYEEDVFHPRKRFKTSELPLNANQRSTIDGLLHTIKKKGHWDTLRKKVWSEFENSVRKPAAQALLAALFFYVSRRTKLISEPYRMQKAASKIDLLSSPMLRSTVTPRYYLEIVGKLQR